MRHCRRAILAVAFFIVTGAITAQAQPLQNPNEVPINCPGTTSQTGWFQGVWFVNVPMTRITSTWAAYYDVEGEPISVSRKWRWVNGGGNALCNRLEWPVDILGDYCPRPAN